MIDVIFADDHQLAVAGLSFFLSSVDDVRVQKIVTNGKDVLPALKEHRPDVLILDMGLPGRHGLDVLRDIKSDENGVRVIVLTGLNAPDLLSDAISAGADAVLTKASDTDEILEALKTVHDGGCYLGSSVRKALEKSPHAANDKAASLTQREQEVLLMIADGQTSHQISEALKIAAPTVRKHRQNMMEKLKLHNSAEITAYVLRRGLNT